ncbi:hypothetical protein BD779DRAFT_1548531 [Infundibulicybe gibba]|nr:hypothetical protein BD779DRAFT_1548531 [Infundibulicybe gibba]
MALQEFAKRKQKEKSLEIEEEQKGMAPVGSLMFAEVERRIDVFIFRCCFTQCHQNANTRLAPGDLVSVNPSAIRFFKSQVGECDDVNGYDVLKSKTQPELASTPEPAAVGEGTASDALNNADIATTPNPPHLTPFYLPTYASPWIFIPAYIEPSFSTCSAIYMRHPTARPGYSEIPTPYDADGEVVRFAWEWYAKRRPRVRSKSRLARMPEDRALATIENVAEGRRLFRKDMKLMARTLQ